MKKLFITIGLICFIFSCEDPNTQKFSLDYTCPPELYGYWINTAHPQNDLVKIDNTTTVFTLTEDHVYTTENSDYLNNYPPEFIYYPETNYLKNNDESVSSYRWVRFSPETDVTFSATLFDALASGSVPSGSLSNSGSRALSDLGSITVMIENLEYENDSASVTVDEVSGEITIVNADPYDEYELTPIVDGVAYEGTTVDSISDNANAGSVFISDLDHKFKTVASTTDNLLIYDEQSYGSVMDVTLPLYEKAPYIIADGESYKVAVIIENQGLEVSPTTTVTVSSPTLLNTNVVKILDQIQPGYKKGFYIDVICNPADISEWKEQHHLKIEIPDSSLAAGWEETLSIPVYKDSLYLKFAGDNYSRDWILVDSEMGVYMVGDQRYRSTKVPVGLTYLLINKTNSGSHAYGVRFGDSNATFYVDNSQVLLNEEALGDPDNTISNMRELSLNTPFYGYSDIDTASLRTIDIDILYFDAR